MSCFYYCSETGAAIGSIDCRECPYCVYYDHSGLEIKCSNPNVRMLTDIEMNVLLNYYMSEVVEEEKESEE